ncbi:uncharacterized protein [Apostichopus japonicus]|uniref:uncharacterized protein isoform X2 n=1 Tax=Stichopus japonicus TaxID=307972 RepID=UPI003AB8FE62
MHYDPTTKYENGRKVGYIMSLRDRSPEPEGGLSELDKILQNLELDNRKESQLLEKEHQQILALEKTNKEKQDGIQRMNEALDKADEDAKALHKQFRQNKENVESLRKHADVLSCHGDTLEIKLQQVREKIEIARDERTTKLNHYQSIWGNYQEKYESSPQAQRWKSCHQEAEHGLRDLMEQADAVKKLTEAIEDGERKLKLEKKENWKTWIIELAKMKVSASMTLQEADLTKKRNTELKEEIEAARQKKEAERAAKEAQERQLGSTEEKEIIHVDESAASNPKVANIVCQPESTPRRRLKIPQLFIPQSPRLISQNSTPRAAPSPIAPPPGTFIEIPQATQRFNAATIQTPTLTKPPSLIKNFPVLSKDPPQMKQPMFGAHTEGHEVNSPSIDEEQEALTQETDEVPMETDANSSQSYIPETPSSTPTTPGIDPPPHPKGTDDTQTQEELSLSQMRERIRNLPRSPGFQFARRPMYDQQEEQPFSPTQNAQNASDTFLSSFFGQTGSASPSLPTDSVMSMFGSPVVSESSEDNFMSLFGPSSQQQVGGTASQEEQASAAFSFNFTPSSTSAETDRTSFSLF